MDLEGGYDLLGWRDEVDEVFRDVLAPILVVAVFAEPVLEFDIVHFAHVAPNSLALTAALPRIDEREHLMVARFTLRCRLPMKV